MKKILLFAVMALVSMGISAQTTVTHVVQRGETAESVASKYGISLSDLQQANPSIKDYFYAGMKLEIPKSSSQKPNNTENVSISTNENTVSITSDTRTSDIKEISLQRGLYSNFAGSDFTSLAVFIGSDFSDLVGVTYGIQGQYFLDNKFGATLILGSSYGNKSDGDVVLKVGPSYVYPINDIFYVMGSACYTLTAAHYQEDSGNVSGFSILPVLGVSLGKIKLGLNGEIRWRNGGSLGAGFYGSIGYSF